MISARKQRLRKKSQFRYEINGRGTQQEYEIPNNAHEIIKSGVEKVNISELTIKDLKKKILQDELNNMQFYDIINVSSHVNIPYQQTDNTGSDQEPKRRLFNSIHSGQDLVALKMNRIYQKKTKSEFEKEVRDLLKSDPDKKFLLSEIYQLFEEELKVNQQNQQDQQTNTKKEQIDHLDSWSKSLKQKKQNSQTKQDPHTIIRSSTQTKSQILPPIKQEDDTKEKLTKYRDKIRNALSKNKKEKQLAENSDRATQKHIQKYLATGKDLNFDEIIPQKNKDDKSKLSEDISESIVFEFTPDGLQRNLQQLAKIHVLKNNSFYEKGNFYAKHSNTIFKKIKAKIELNKQFVEQKQEMANLLRVETHEIRTKIEQIRILLKQLTKEHSELSNNKQSNKQINIEDKKNEKNKFIQALMDAQKKVKDLENDMALLWDSLRNFQKKVLFNQNMLDKMDGEIYQKEKEYKHLQKAYFSFYYYLLETGLDFRNTGIAWIVTKLHIYKQKVEERHLPSYLDQKAKEFILKKSLYLQQMDELYNSQSKSFKIYQQSAQLDKSISLLENSNLLDASMPSLLINDLSKFTAIDIEQIKYKESLKKNKQITIEEISDLTKGLKQEHTQAIQNICSDINLRNNMTAGYLIYQESQNRLHDFVKKQSEPKLQQNVESEEINQVEIAVRDYEKVSKKIEKKKAKFKEKENEELIRIVKEFDFKQYARKYNIDPGSVFAVLFGGQRAEKELIKNGMSKRNYLDQLQ